MLLLILPVDLARPRGARTSPFVLAQFPLALFTESPVGFHSKTVVRKT